LFIKYFNVSAYELVAGLELPYDITLMYCKFNNEFYYFMKLSYYILIMSSFKENLSGFFPRHLPVVKISPEWVTVPQQGKSSGRIATFSLLTGMFRDGISSIPGETIIPL